MKTPIVLANSKKFREIYAKNMLKSSSSGSMYGILGRFLTWRRPNTAQYRVRYAVMEQLSKVNPQIYPVYRWS